MLFAFFCFRSSLLFKLEHGIPPLQNEQGRKPAGWDFPGGLAAVCPGTEQGT